LLDADYPIVVILAAKVDHIDSLHLQKTEAFQAVDHLKLALLIDEGLLVVRTKSYHIDTLLAKGQVILGMCDKKATNFAFPNLETFMPCQS
jgi:hypothetical protein